MRITSRMITDNAINHMEESQDRLYGLQDRIASGKQFQTLSDDPVRVSSALSLRSSLQSNQNYIDTDNTVNDWIGANETGLSQMSDLAVRAKNLALQGATDSAGQKERATLATEIDGILQNGVELANMRQNGKYVFAGMATKSATPPFVLAADHNSIAYNDDTHLIQVSISPGQSMTTNFIGSTTFKPFFDSLIQLRDALNANDVNAIATAMSAVDSATDPIDTARTTNGVRQRQLNVTLDSMANVQIELKSLLSSKEDVNLADAVTQLKAQETNYQAVLQVSARATSMMSLFDKLG